jgi:ribonuclease HI
VLAWIARQPEVERLVAELGFRVVVDVPRRWLQEGSRVETYEELGGRVPEEFGDTRRRPDILIFMDPNEWGDMKRVFQAVELTVPKYGRLGEAKRLKGEKYAATSEWGKAVRQAVGSGWEIPSTITLEVGTLGELAEGDEGWRSLWDLCAIPTHRAKALTNEVRQIAARASLRIWDASGIREWAGGPPTRPWFPGSTPAWQNKEAIRKAAAEDRKWREALAKGVMEESGGEEPPQAEAEPADQCGAEAEQPTGEAGQPKVEAEQPKGEAGQPKAEAEQPKGEAGQPKAEAEQPKGEAGQPKGEAEQPKGEADQPRSPPERYEMSPDRGATGQSKIEKEYGARWTQEEGMLELEATWIERGLDAYGHEESGVESDGTTNPPKVSASGDRPPVRESRESESRASTGKAGLFFLHARPQEEWPSGSEEQPEQKLPEKRTRVAAWKRAVRRIWESASKKEAKPKGHKGAGTRGWIKGPSGARGDEFPEGAGRREGHSSLVGKAGGGKEPTEVPLDPRRDEGWVVYKGDGASKNNGKPGGRAGRGWVKWKAADGQWVLCAAACRRGHDGRGNNSMEMLAILDAVADAEENGHAHALIVTDSNISADWLLGRAEARQVFIKETRDEIWTKVARLSQVAIWHVPRQFNGEGDLLANLGCGLDGIGAEKVLTAPEFEEAWQRFASGGPSEAPRRDRSTRARLRERVDVAALREALGECETSQPMAVRLLKLAEEGPVWTEYEKPRGGGRAVAKGTSGQKLWRHLRKAAFRGYCSYDVAGSHLALANGLTRGQFGAISELVSNYEPSLRDLAGATAIEGDAGRKAAKAFFLSTLNGGAVQGWREKHGISRQCKLTPLARRFLAEVRELRAHVASSIPDAAAAAQARGKSAMAICLHEAEDRSLQCFERVASKHGAEIGLLVYDELLVWKEGRTDEELERLGVEASREATEHWGAPVRFVLSPNA